MIRTTLLTCSILTFLPSIAMKRLCVKKDSQRPLKRLRQEQTLQLPEEIEHIIIQEAINSEHKLRGCIQIIKAIALTSKKNYSQLSNQQNCYNLIKKLSQKFYCPQETITKNLHTPCAKKRSLLQTKLLLLCEDKWFANDFTEKFTVLIKDGADIDFTYDHDKQPQTILMMHSNHLLDKNLTLSFNTLLKLANFNTETSQKKTLLINAVEYPINCSRLRQIIAFKKNDANPFFTDINFQNSRGDSALLHCIKNRMDNPVTNVFVSAITMLLKQGANPLLPDKYGKTALELVYDLPDLSELRDETIQLVKGAIEKWTSSQ